MQSEKKPDKAKVFKYEIFAIINILDVKLPTHLSE